eukprot:8698863-Pyramimonas_sp.AAC.1
MLRRVHGPTFVMRSMDDCHCVHHHGRMYPHKKKSFDCIYNVDMLGQQLEWPLLPACITKLKVDQERTPKPFGVRA